MTLDALSEEIERRAAVIAWHRREITEQEAEMARLFKERKDRGLRPAPGAGEKETTDG